MSEREGWLAATLERAAEHDEPSSASDWADVLARAERLTTAGDWADVLVHDQGHPAPHLPLRPARGRPIRRRPRRLGAVALVGVVAIVASSLALTRNVDQHAGLTPIQRARAALVVPHDRVFHVRIEFSGAGAGAQTTTWNEIWQSADSYRSLAPGIDAGRTADGHDQRYDAAANRITVSPAPAATAGNWWFSDIYTADVRALLTRPDAHVTGTAMVHGIRCLVISGPAADTASSNTFYADADTYRPVAERIVSTTGTQEIWFNVWEVLPADTATLRLTDQQQLHPDAQTVTVATSAPPPPTAAVPLP